MAGGRRGDLGAGRRPACRRSSRSTASRTRRRRRRRPAARRVRRVAARRPVRRRVHAVSAPLRRRREPTGDVDAQSPGDTDGRPARRDPRDPQPGGRRRRRRRRPAARRARPDRTRPLASTVDSLAGPDERVHRRDPPAHRARPELDEFNSAFGRLAVTCTRATHGLLLVSRPGLDDLLRDAPARPGTPFGEPGVRQLPRQTHQRILATFARGTTDRHA